MLRPPCYRIFQHHKDVIRAAWKATGLKPRENEEEFIVGRLNYEKGARPPFIVGRLNYKIATTTNHPLF